MKTTEIQEIRDTVKQILQSFPADMEALFNEINNDLYHYGSWSLGFSQKESSLDIYTKAEDLEKFPWKRLNNTAHQDFNPLMVEIQDLYYNEKLQDRRAVVIIMKFPHIVKIDPLDWDKISEMIGTEMKPFIKKYRELSKNGVQAELSGFIRKLNANSTNIVSEDDTPAVLLQVDFTISTLGVDIW